MEAPAATPASSVAASPAYVVAAARGLQGYVLRSPRLRRMIGASELIDQITGVLLGRALTSLGLLEGADYRIFSAVAGAARLYFTRRDQAERFLAIWPLLVSRHAPGLEVVQSLAALDPGATIESASAAGERAASRHRNLVWPELPVAGLVSAFCPQSGLPARRYSPQGEWLDGEALAKDRAVADAREGLLRRTVGEHAGWTEEDWERFPQDVGAIAGDDRQYLAIVHADANGMAGRVVMLARRLRGYGPEAMAERFQAFSLAIERGTQAAVRQALEPILEAFPRPQIVPFRPVVCAGDDITVILAAPYALGFARRLLLALPTAIEHEFEQRFTEIELRDLGCNVTAAAGIVYAKASYPFASAYEVCESLGKLAKERTGRGASAVAFHRLTTPAPGDLEEIVVPGSDSTAALRLTMNPYTVGRIPGDATEAQALPRLGSLEGLVRTLGQLPRGPLRQLVSETASSAWGSEEKFRRLLVVLRTRGVADPLREPDPRREGPSTPADQLVAALRSLTGNTDDATVFRTVGPKDHPGATPLYDAIQLRSVGTQLDGDENEGLVTPEVGS